MRSDSLEQAVLGEWFCQVFVGADHATARPVEKAILGRQHDDRRDAKARVFLDQRTGLVAIQPRHQNVTKNKVRVVIANFGQCIKAVLRQDHVVLTRLEKNFSAATDGVAVIHHQDLQI